MDRRRRQAVLAKVLRYGEPPLLSWRSAGPETNAKAGCSVKHG
jgi:hypothetical protein